jgi:hypothetical protein
MEAVISRFDLDGLPRRPLWREALMIMLLLPAVGFAEGRFVINELKLEGEVNNMVIEDVDKDGLRDLVVFHADASIKTPRRRVTVLWQDKVSGFSLGQSFELEPGPEVAAMDVGQVDGKAGPDLIGLCPSGVIYYPNQGRDFGPKTRLLDKDTALALASPRTLPLVDFVMDWNGDGYDDVLLFRFSQALLYSGGENGIDASASQPLSIKPWGDVLAAGGVKGDEANQQDLISMNLYLPRAYSRDWNGDGKMDLVVVGRKDIRVFQQSDGGAYPPQPGKEYEVELFSPEDENFSAQPYYPYYPPSLSLADVDQDGKCDLVGQQMVGLLGSMKSKVVLYWGKTGSLDTGVPDVEFKPKDLGIMVLVADVNRDGLHDIVVPTLGLNLFSVGRVLVTGGFPVEINYYLQKENNSFAKDPDFTKTVDLVFDLEKFRLAAGIPGVFADINGDGYPDDAIGKTKTKLEISINDSTGEHSGQKETISLPVGSMIIVKDLDGDNKAEIVLNYLDDPDHRGELRVLMNKGNW